MYDLTTQLAKHKPGRREQILLRRVRTHPGETERFLAAFAGITNPASYFSVQTLLRLM
jgi:hypothetical protein